MTKVFNPLVTSGFDEVGSGGVDIGDTIGNSPSSDGILYVDSSGNLQNDAQVALVDTKANILASTPSIPQTAYATDSEEFFIFDGTYWNASALRLARDLPNPDIGSEQNSGRRGYGNDYITDKTLVNSVLGGNARNETGAIRIDTTKDPDTFEIYLRGAWQNIIYDLTAESGDFRHTPLNEQIYIWRGDSVSVGLNGQPIIQEYKASMGAYPDRATLSGGEF